MAGLVPDGHAKTPEDRQEWLKEVPAEGIDCFSAKAEGVLMERGVSPEKEAEAHTEGFPAANGAIADNGVPVVMRGIGTPPVKGGKLNGGKVMEGHDLPLLVKFWRRCSGRRSGCWR